MVRMDEDIANLYAMLEFEEGQKEQQRFDISKLMNRITSIRERIGAMGGRNAVRDAQVSIERQIKLLENRLEQVLQKQNAAHTDNRMLRSDIDSMQEDKKTKKNLLEKLESELESKKLAIGKKIRDASRAYASRDKFLFQTTALKERMDIEVADLRKEWTMLNDLIKDDTATQHKEREKLAREQLKINTYYGSLRGAQLLESEALSSSNGIHNENNHNDNNSIKRPQTTTGVESLSQDGGRASRRREFWERNVLSNSVIDKTLEELGVITPEAFALSRPRKLLQRTKTAQSGLRPSKSLQHLQRVGSKVKILPPVKGSSGSELFNNNSELISKIDDLPNSLDNKNNTGDAAAVNGTALGLRASVAREAIRISDEEQRVKVSLERLEFFERAFSQIQLSTGAADLSSLLATFVQREEKSFSLFKQNNERAQERVAEELEVQNLKAQLNELSSGLMSKKSPSKSTHDNSNTNQSKGGKASIDTTSGERREWNMKEQIAENFLIKAQVAEATLFRHASIITQIARRLSCIQSTEEVSMNNVADSNADNAQKPQLFMSSVQPSSNKASTPNEIFPSAMSSTSPSTSQAASIETAINLFGKIEQRATELIKSFANIQKDKRIAMDVLLAPFPQPSHQGSTSNSPSNGGGFVQSASQQAKLLVMRSGAAVLPPSDDEEDEEDVALFEINVGDTVRPMTREELISKCLKRIERKDTLLIMQQQQQQMTTASPQTGKEARLNVGDVSLNAGN